MKKSLTIISLLIVGVYLSGAININLGSGEKLENNIWTNLSSVINKMDVDNNDLKINGELSVSGEICDANDNCLGKYGTETDPGLSCSDILNFDSSNKNKNGIYWIKPDSNPAFKVYCDMTTSGGGWVLFGVLNSPTDNFSGYQGIGSFDGGTLGIDNLGYSLKVDKLDNSTNKFDVMIKYGKDNTFDLVKKGISKDGNKFFMQAGGGKTPQEAPYHGSLGDYRTNKIDGNYGFLYCANRGGCEKYGNNYLNYTKNFGDWWPNSNTGVTPYGWSGHKSGDSVVGRNWKWNNTPTGDNQHWQRFFIRY